MRVQPLLVPALLIAALGAISCSKEKSSSPPARASAATPPPAEVALVVTLPSLEEGLAGVGAFVDAVQPGVGGMLAGQVDQMLPSTAGAAALDGLDRKKPMRLVLLDPPAGQGEAGTVLLVGVNDAKALEQAAGTDVRVESRGGFALVGAPKLVEQVAPWALGVLAQEPAPKVPLAVVYPAAILAAHRADLEAARSQMGAAMAQGGNGGAGGEDLEKLGGMYVDGLIAMLEASERVELRVEGSGEQLSVDLALVPRAGTTLASFVAAQKPSRYALLERLPASDATLFMAGHVELGPVRAGLMPLLEKAMTSLMHVPLDDTTRAALIAIMDECSGELAAAGNFGGGGSMQMDILYGVGDAAKAGSALRIFGGAMIGNGGRVMEVMGMKMTIDGNLDAATYDGVKLLSYKTRIDYATVPPAQVESMKQLYGADGVETRGGAWDDVLGMAFGQGAPERATRLVDATRGKGAGLTLPAGVAKLADDSRARGESLIYVFDLLGVMRSFMGSAASAASAAGGSSSGGFVMALGFQGGHAHLRFAVPAEAARQVMGAVAGGQMR